MSETWWHTKSWGGLKITPVQVIKSTPGYLTLPPDEYSTDTRRVAKGTEYFPTFAAARTFHMGRLANYISSRQNDINKAREDLNMVFMMEEPK